MTARILSVKALLSLRAETLDDVETLMTRLYRTPEAAAVVCLSDIAMDARYDPVLTLDVRAVEAEPLTAFFERLLDLLEELNDRATMLETLAPTGRFTGARDEGVSREALLQALTAAIGVL